MSANSINPRRIISAIVAIAFTVALHGSWLSGMDRDAAAVTTQRI